MSNGKILIYHGANIVVEQPEIRSVNRAMDFGVGFYATTLKEQAKTWAIAKTKVAGGNAAVNVYELDIDSLKQHLSYREFIGVSDEWLDFVVKHRQEMAYIIKADIINGQTVIGMIPNKEVHHTYDLVCGEVADDTVYRAGAKYERSLITREQLRVELKTKKENNQYCFCAPEALNFLKFINILYV